MVKITLEVLLDNEFAIFYPEQIIGGKVKLTINDELKVSAINIKLEAHGNVRWSEGSGNNRRTYSSHECYLNEVQCLLAKAKGEKDIMLPSGTHEYPFRFQLPKQLPSSFEGQIGHVRYQLKGHVDRPWAFDSRCKRVFTLVNPVDLNTLPDLTKNISIEKSKHLCCCCCKSDPIIATMTVKNRRGYVPGETILFSAEIKNKSGRSMKRSVGRLTMEVTYHATSKSRTCTNILTKTEQGRIKSKSSDTWTDGKLQIPAVPPSFLQYCNIIDIRYYAQMQVVPAGPAISLKVPVEIVIGNVPLKEVADQYNVNFSSAPIPTGAPRGLYSDTSIPSNNPHASFAESVFGRKSIKDDEDDNNTSGDLDFVPKYTYYNWETRDPISNFTVK